MCKGILLVVFANQVEFSSSSNIGISILLQGTQKQKYQSVSDYPFKPP